MVAKLVEATEAMDIKQLTLLVYGQPGSKKTSLSQTADRPFTLAFDSGVYRAFGRKSCMLFDAWEDVVQFGNDADLLRRGSEAPARFTVAADQERYIRALRYYIDSKTIVIDTLGMCLDRMSETIAQESPKNRSPFGGLSLPGYGALKNRFYAWAAPWKARGQDIVVVCHEKEVKRGDEVYYQPDIVGSSYNTIMFHADAVGYLHFDGGKRVIGWHPTDRYMAKTPPCGWGVMALPDFGKEPDFLARLLEQAKASMGRVSGESAKLAQQVEDWRAKVEATASPEALTALLPHLAELSEQVKRPAWALTLQLAERRQWKWNGPSDKRFTGTAVTPPAPPPEPPTPPAPEKAPAATEPAPREPGSDDDAYEGGEQESDTNFNKAKKGGRKKAGTAS